MKKEAKDSIEIESIEYNITMNGNVSLFGRATLPKTKGKYPVILSISPYIFYEPFSLLALGIPFAKSGYVFLMVYVRGTVKSSGEWYPFHYERIDGRSVIDWISKQEWCDGNIGTFGASYVGLTQWCIADYEHPMLKTMFISVFGGHPYSNFYRRGMFREMIWSGWSANMIDDNRFKIFSQEEDWNLRQFVYNLSIQTQLGEELKGKPCNWYKELVTGINENGNYWRQGFWKEMNEVPEKIKIPIFFHGGWYDPFLRSQLEGYRRLQKDIRKMSRFIIGPWGHSGSPCGSLTYPGENVTDIFLIKDSVEWFDHQLKGKKYPKKKGVIDAYCIKGDKWITWNDDFTSNNKIILYLKKNENNIAHYLVKKNPKFESISYEYDPKKPVQSLGGNMITNNRIPGAAPDCCIQQLDPGSRNDIISFISETLQEDAWITGSIEVHLFVSSSANATAFTIKVIEIFADGMSINIVDDITDIRWIDEENYIPGSIRELVLKMNDISWKISSNSKVRIDISSSNFPYYNAHPNIDKIWSETSEKIVANQKIYLGGDFPSRIILPIMENQKQNKKKTIFIAGVVIIAISIVLIVCIVTILCYKKRKQNSKQSSQIQESLINLN